MECWEDVGQPERRKTGNEGCGLPTWTGARLSNPLWPLADFAVISCSILHSFGECITLNSRETWASRATRVLKRTAYTDSIARCSKHSACPACFLSGSGRRWRHSPASMFTWAGWTRVGGETKAGCNLMLVFSWQDEPAGTDRGRQPGCQLFPLTTAALKSISAERSRPWGRGWYWMVACREIEQIEEHDGCRWSSNAHNDLMAHVPVWCFQCIL